MFNAIKKIRESSSTSPVAEAEGTIMEEVIENKVKLGAPVQTVSQVLRGQGWVSLSSRLAWST